MDGGEVLSVRMAEVLPTCSSFQDGTAQLRRPLLSRWFCPNSPALELASGPKLWRDGFQLPMKRAFPCAEPPKGKQ